MLSLKKIYNLTLTSCKKNPIILAPFAIYAILELIGLLVVYSIPRYPLTVIFGPIIRTLWGEMFLHYPSNFLLLPKLASLLRMVTSVTVGSLLTGIAIAILYKKSPKDAVKKYVSLFLITFIIAALFYCGVKIITIILLKYFFSGHTRLLFIKSNIWFGPILLIINMLMALFIQSAFVYTIPALFSKENKFISAIFESLKFFKKHFGLTLILVGLPMLIYLPITILNHNTGFLIRKLFPEFILLIAFLNLIINSLIIDPLITISTALFYYESNKK